MGLQIKQNAKGLFNLVSSVSDGQLHEDNYITQEQAALVIIERMQLDFMAKAIETSMTFPAGYMVNGKYAQGKYDSSFHDWYGQVLREDNYFELVKEKYNQIPNVLKFE